ncbi:MAG: DUF1566 domain-containing protein, partial [Desulforhabdus sp.]|nr:DUF1566 domain-containing protein [Desulforhabdus sp.]
MWLNRFPVFAATCIFVFSLVLVQCGDAPAYILPDSGQTSCYTGLGYEAPCPALGQPYHGQDGNYIGAQLAYQDNSDGTVTDLNTGLVWQQSDDQNMNRSSHGEAEAYCGSLELGSYSDWRLPTQHELLSVVNYGRSNPSIHTTYFPGCLSDGYWSNDSSDTYGNYWYVDFYYGDVGGVLGWGARGDPMYIRCVRGEPLSKSNFVMNDNGTVTDTVTGLIWQREALQNEYTWKQALSYCEALSLAGADRSEEH